MPSFSMLGLLKTMITAHHALPDYRSMQRKTQSAASLLITYVLFLRSETLETGSYSFQEAQSGD